jgi:hypothetical protein
MQVPYFPPVQSLADFPASKCRDILRKAAGLPNLEVDVRTVKTWNMSAQVAERFQVTSAAFWFAIVCAALIGSTASYTY